MHTQASQPPSCSKRRNGRKRVRSAIAPSAPGPPPVRPPTGTTRWASTLPTWRFKNRLTRLFLGNRVATGYHVYFQLLVWTVLHVPYAVGLPFSLAAEMRIVAFGILFWVLEDYFWFVVNPAFGLRRFDREHIWWHAANWWGVMPRDYWIFTPLGVALYFASNAA